MKPLGSFLIVLLAFLAAQKVAAAQKLTVCANDKQFEECQQVKRSDEVECRRYYNKIDCLLGISNGTNSFGVVSADEAIMASRRLPNIDVLAEIRSDEFKTNSSLDIVVLVKDSIKVNKLGDLKGLKLCHPGFSKMTIPRYAVNVFEETLLEAISPATCADKKNSMLGTYMRTLHDFFGPSCRPGIWTEDFEMDADLKRNFQRLCDLCPNKGENKCSDETITNPFQSSLDCFQNEGGEVVITTQATVQKNAVINPTYLCKNGTTTRRPCYWLRRPWNLLVVNKADTGRVEDLIYVMFEEKLTPSIRRKGLTKSIDITPYLTPIVFPNADDRLIFTNKTRKNDLLNYIVDFEAQPVATRCNRSFRWCCVSAAEMEKCRWLKAAALAQGLFPGVDCVQEADELHCLEAVKNNNADLAVTDNKYGYAARKKFLKPVAYPETPADDLTRSMIVIRTENPQNISKLADLRNKFGCFAEFGDIAYMSFFELLRVNKLSKRGCDYGINADDFLRESCLPGVQDPLHEPTNALTNPGKHCSCAATPTSRTAKTCAAGPDNEYFNNTGALLCLKQAGDFAIITNKDIVLDQKEFRVMCKNGSLSQQEGLNVDEDCYMSIVTTSEVMMRKDDPQEADIVALLQSFEKVFGQDLHKPFQLFNRFNNTKNLLFRDSTPGLSFDADETDAIRNLHNIFKDYNGCILKGDSGVSGLHATTWLALLATAIIVRLA